MIRTGQGYTRDTVKIGPGGDFSTWAEAFSSSLSPHCYEGLPGTVTDTSNITPPSGSTLCFNSGHLSVVNGCSWKFNNSNVFCNGILRASGTGDSSYGYLLWLNQVTDISISASLNLDDVTGSTGSLYIFQSQETSSRLDVTLNFEPVTRDFGKDVYLATISSDYSRYKVNAHDIHNSAAGKALKLLSIRKFLGGNASWNNIDVCCSGITNAAGNAIAIETTTSSSDNAIYGATGDSDSNWTNAAGGANITTSLNYT